MLSGVYLMCSLPALSYGKEPPVSMEDFMVQVRNELGARKARRLEAISIQDLQPPAKDSKGKSKRSGKLAQLQNALLADMTEIRKARVEERAAKMEALPPTLAGLNPLQREMGIMKWQWEELDALSRGKEFTLKDVILYKLRLELLIRMSSFSKQRGAAIMDGVVNPALNPEAQSDAKAGAQTLEKEEA